MEFPELGAHCSFSSCRRLDFLPVKCVGCHGLYCKEHYPYAQHNCRSPGIQDKQVPVCPLCNTVVPIRPGESPDERVGQHIDTACKSQPALELKGKNQNNNNSNNNQTSADRIRYDSAEEAERKRQEEEDRQLALAISASLMDDQPRNETNVRKNSSCNLS
ncbi:hypothetical protein T265_01128 [Opisthorchis viverrini]|uniref:AN1-type domain-containing protein n=1 Tax=Opisthorchis viverrini TaxID=6198 RepID=A0A074ZZF3_OPIVI|nr:hypothetical protein T265_01128 [Opisthorchis viverrini]KER32838.1 hypothetical protein T265_01128 [Opisthorchis viverrini]